MNESTCLLCNARGAAHRPGRLGRYAQTCDTCEQRRGQAAAARPAPVEHTMDFTSTGQMRALQWSARPR